MSAGDFDWESAPLAEEPDAAGFDWDSAPVADAPNVVAAPAGPMLAALPETDEPELAPLPDNSTRLRALFEVGLKDAPDRRAGILALARRADLPADVVEARYDDFSRAAQAADFDADAFRRDFPTLADEMLRRPELGGVAPALQKQAGIIRLFGAAYRFLTDDQGLKEANDAAEARRKAGLPEEELQLRGFPSMEELFPAPREVPTLVAPEAAATGLGRPAAILGAELGRASRLVERDKLGVALMLRRARGGDDWDLKKRLADLEEATVERDYGQGAFLQPLIETARQLPQQWEGLKAGGAMGAAIAAGGAALGAATRRPGGVRLGVKLGARLGMAEGLFLSTFETAMGGAYLEMADVTADDGTPISEDVRAGAAIVRGLTEAGVEVATLGPFLRMFGAPGAALAAASPRAFVQEAMKDAGKRQALASFGRRFLGGVGGEMSEEATASLLGDVTTWVARSAEAGAGGTFEGQSFDWEASKLKAVEAAGTAAVSTGVTGLAGNALSAVPTELYRRGASRRAEARVAAAIQLGKESPLAEAAPEALAAVIAQKGAETGESLTHMHIAAEPLQRFFQETFPDNPNAAAEFLGEDGVRQLQEAIATGEKFAVPVATYLEKWAKAPISEALQPHTTTAPGHRTTVERQAEEADEAQIEAQARALADSETQGQAAADVQEDAASAEARLVDAPQAGLRAAGLSRQEAAASVEPLRALLRTQAVRMGVPADVLFQQYGLTVTPGSEATSPLKADVDAALDAQPAIPDTALRQESQDDDGLPVASRALKESFAKEDVATRRARYFRDYGTGLLNERAFNALPPDASRPLVAHVSVEGMKWINDYRGPGGRHSGGDAAYRAAAHALATLVPDAARVGGDFLLRVESPERLATLLAEANANPVLKGLRLTGAVGPDAEAAQAQHILLKDTMEKEGARAARGERPLATTAETPEGLGFPKERPEVVVPESLAPAFAEVDDATAFTKTYLDADDTGLLSEAGFRAQPEKASRLSIDLDGLALANTTGGRELGDAMLVAFGDLMAYLGASRFDGAHVHGDEYLAQADSDAELSEFVEELSEWAERITLPYTNKLTGERGVYRGVGFSFGIGANDDAADDALADHKKQRQERGERGPAVTAARFRPAEQSGADAGGGQGGDSSRGNRVERGSPLAAGGGQAPRRRAPPQAFSRDGGGKKGPGRLEQSAAGSTPRGYVDIRREGMQRVFNVVLNPEADLSTFLHESGHTFLEIMGDLAAREDAPQQLRDDYRTALEHLGVNTREEIGREQHELFARSFETWLLEGNAPSVGLARFFQRFKLWLMRIYRDAAALNAPLSPELRGVFDRLFATDEEIARARRASGLQPLFRSPEEAGMSPEAWATYLREQEAAVASATQATQHRILKDRLRETESWWKQEEKALREDARTEYDARPDAQASAYIRKGVLQGEEGEAPKLDRDAAYAALGEARAKLLLRGRLEKDGESPDTVAELFGYPTGKAMLEALEALPEREAWARETAAQRMREKYPDILEEKDRLGEAAQKHLHTEATGGWLVREWKALREKAGEAGDPPLEAIRRAARLIVERRPVRRLDVGRALAAERSAATKAAVAAAKGQYREAYVLQQQRLLNFYLHRELTKARDDRATFEEQLSDMQTPRRRSQLGLGGAAFLGTSDSILEAVGAKEVGDDVAQREGLDALLARLEGEGLAPAFDTAALRALLAQPKEWKELTVDEMRNTSDALKQLRKLGRDASSVRDADTRRAAADVAADIAREAEALPDRGPEPASDTATSRGYFTKQRVQGLLAAMIDPELLLSKLGPRAHRFFWDGYLTARATEDKLAEKVLRFFAEKWDALPKAMQARRYDLVDASGLPFPEDVNLGGARDRQWMWMVWLNRGSGSNLERLLGGYGWTQAQVDTFLAANMTKEEADFLQGIHDLMDKELYPEMARAYEATNGVRPPKVKPLAIEMPFGTYAGGYIPARYSPVASRLGLRQAESAVSNLYGNGAARASVAKGFTKERAKVFTDVINLNWSGVPSHVAQVVHYVAFDGFVRDAARVLYHPDMAMALQRRLGTKYQAQLDAWLKVVASAQADAVPETLADVMATLGAGRSRFVMASIGYSLTVAAGDFANPLLAIATGDVKARYLAPALASLRNFPAMRRDAEAKSAELRHRADSAAGQLRREMGEIGKQGRRTRASAALEAVRETAFVFMSWTDKLTSTIVWDGAYRQALAEGAKDTDAVKRADKTVRDNFPANDLAEQPALLRDKRSVGALLAFFGYFSKLGNVNRRVWSEPLTDLANAEGAKETALALPSIAAAAGRTLAIFFVTGVVSELLSGRGKEEDEEWAEWVVRKMLVAPFGLIPLVGGAGEAGANAAVDLAFKGEVKNRPISMRSAPVAATVQRLWKAIATAADSDKEDDERLGRVLEAAGVLAKLPVSQPQRTVGYWWDVGTGDESPEDIADFLSGTIYGKRAKQGANPLSVVSGAGGP